MNVLVTGGTGFIGSHLVDLLLEKHFSVRLFSRKEELPERLKKKDVTVFHGNLSDAETVLRAMSGMDLFYHIGEMKNTSRAAAARNTLLVERIVEQLARTGIKRFVFVSSISVSGISSLSIICLPRKKPCRECSLLALLRSMISTMVGLRPCFLTK